LIVESSTCWLYGLIRHPLLHLELLSKHILVFLTRLLIVEASVIEVLVPFLILLLLLLLLLIVWLLLILFVFSAVHIMTIIIN
jgi:hypothetical protein